MQRFRNNGLAGAIALITAAMVSAGTQAAVEEAAHIDMGVFELTPGLTTVFSHDDNVYKDRVERSSNVLTVNPSLEFKAIQGVNEYGVLLDVKSSRYFSEREADYTDYLADFDIHQEFNSRNRVDLSLAAGELHDLNALRGSDGRRPPEYIKKAGDFVYGFGSEEAKAQVEFFGGIENKNYKKTNNKDSSAKTLGATVYYRVMPKTSVLVEVKNRDLQYDDKQLIGGVLQNAGFDVSSYLLGLDWEATAKTSGYVKAGRRYRDTDVSGISTESANGWEVGVSYQPLPYSTLQLSTSRDYGLETDNPAAADFTNGINTTLSWNHEWTDRISSDVSWTVVSEEVENASGETLKDRDSDTISLSLNWKVRRWLTVSAGYSYDARDESLKADGQTDNGYNRNVYTLSAEMSL